MRVSLESQPGPAEAHLSETELQALKERAQGQLAASAGGNKEPRAPAPKVGEVEPYSIRNKEEADLVARMKGQGRSPEEILTALHKKRAGESGEDNSGAPDTFKLGRLVAPGFEAPKVFVNRQGLLTNGTYTLDQPGMAPHLTGNLASGKSQFFYRLNAQQVTLDAAAYADKAGLWVGNKAKVTLDGPIGVHAGTGKPTNVLNLYRSSTGHVHAAPGTPE